MWLKRPVYRGFSGEGKCEGKLSPLTLALTTKILNPFCPAKAQSKDKSKNKKSKRKSKKGSVKRLRDKSVIFRERFFDLSSVAAGSQSATQQVE